LVLLGIIAFHPAEPEILLQFSHRNDAAWRFHWLSGVPWKTGQTSFFFQEAKAISALKAPATLLLSL